MFCLSKKNSLSLLFSILPHSDANEKEIFEHNSDVGQDCPGLFFFESLKYCLLGLSEN